MVAKKGDNPYPYPEYSFSYDQLEAAARTGYSRGFSDRKRGAQRSAGTVVYLHEWIERRAGAPDLDSEG